MNKINRLSHNWLVYEINNKSLERHLEKIKGYVIDLGCGISPYRDDILGVARNYLGIDWTESFHDLPYVNLFANISVTFPLKNCCADTVVAFQVIEHLPEPNIFLYECNRVLFSGGILFITVPFNWHVHEEPHDYYRYTRYGINYLLKKNGFDRIIIEENTGFWQMWVLKLNYHTTRYAKGILKYLLIPFWYFGQLLAPRLDNIDNHPQETLSYTIIAKKS